MDLNLNLTLNLKLNLNPNLNLKLNFNWGSAQYSTSEYFDILNIVVTWADAGRAADISYCCTDPYVLLS